MFTRLLTNSLKHNPRKIQAARCIVPRRTISDDAVERKSKYMDKLRQKAEESGLTIQQLIEKAKSEEAEKRKAEAEKLRSTIPTLSKAADSPATTSGESKPAPRTYNGERKDAPPYRPLSTILNLDRILESPHTADQISALWTTYHASRSSGTGRGFVCATIPLDQYQKLENVGKRYPTFVVPLPRVQQTPEAGESEEEVAHEFFFLQWDFHPAPPIPSVSGDLFSKPTPVAAEGANPQSSTVLFTPLQEYKLRGSFATPYLILTIYTDLAATHGVVLLRGEITPSPGDPTKFLLPQIDAQVLTLSLQKFYLWGTQNNSEEIPEGQRLLKAFHESPQDFKWEDLLAFSKLTI